jgi:hypothetical protein
MATPVALPRRRQSTGASGWALLERSRKRPSPRRSPSMRTAGGPRRPAVPPARRASRVAGARIEHTASIATPDRRQHLANLAYNHVDTKNSCRGATEGFLTPAIRTRGTRRAMPAAAFCERVAPRRRLTLPRDEAAVTPGPHRGHGPQPLSVRAVQFHGRGPPIPSEAARVRPTLSEPGLVVYCAANRKAGPARTSTRMPAPE